MPVNVPLISVVIPVLNEADCLSKLYEELRLVCDPLPYDFEFLFVDDGSTDQTGEMLAGLRQGDERICYLLLSRNFGHQAALSAGLNHADGDAVIMMDGDLQHPPQLIPNLLECWRNGYDVVNTLRIETEGIHPFKRLSSSLFYRVFNWAANISLKPGSADFRLLARVVVNVLNELPERHRFLRGLIPWMGFRQTVVEFTAPCRWAGRSKYNFLRSFRFALDGITAFSFYPLRRLTILGWLITLASLLYGVYALTAHLLGRDTVPGWTSLLLCILFFGGCQLLVAGVLGEYIGRILEQVKGRPLYISRASAGLSSVNRGRSEPPSAARPWPPVIRVDRKAE
ncbi:MAG TPA: glycosyltransferase family 2 protein [Gemmataceae bacterium]|nr:glycosyltransferase family 2 protein [Gemmataceae bacterium]